MSNVLTNKLVAEGVITKRDAIGALNLREREGVPLIFALEVLGVIKEDKLVEIIADKFGIKSDKSALRDMDTNIVEKLSLDFSQKYNIVSYKEVDGYIYVAVNDPFNRRILENARIQLQSEHRLIPVIVSSKTIMGMLSYLQVDEEIIEEEGFEEVETVTNVDIEELNISSRVDSAPLVKLVDAVIVEAFRVGASDIHIEPQKTMTNIRFRVDGGLFIHRSVNKEVHNLITSRIKIMAGLDPSNRNVPQDGSLHFESKYVSVDLRVSVLPSSHGEKVVMRLLGADKNITYELHSLGLKDHIISAIEKAIRVPNGIFLVSGPTGSGKTTTLYSILQKLSTPESSITTVEDPVERDIPGITQVQVNNKAGTTFAGSLRSILRQDPDTIMIGEMRDAETATIAARAAITGHLVLSTIHTNDSIATVSRLIDMGVEPFMIASALKTVIAQRLVKKTCEHCKVEHINTDLEKELINYNEEKSFAGEGCEECNFTGYKGRTAVFEIVMIDKTLQKMISEKRTEEEMRDYIKTTDVITMRDEVLNMLKEGSTTIEEAVKILYNTD